MVLNGIRISDLMIKRKKEMSKRFLSFTWFSIVIVLYIISIIFVTNQNSQHNKRNIYNNWQTKYVVNTSEGKYINTVNNKTNGVVLSESQGYGMLISVLAGDQKESEKQFYDLYRYYDSHRIKNTSLMSWRHIDGKKNSSHDTFNNATDGDLYIAYALILASEKWGDHKFTYKAAAKNILQDILKYNLNQTTNVLTVGNWANEGTKYHNLMRTSDVLPAVFDKFYDFSGNKKWQLVKKNMVDVLYRSSMDNNSGLIPDFVQITNTGMIKPFKNGKSLQLNKHDNDYYYNAFRIPYNLAESDNRNKRETIVLNRMMAFFNSQSKITSGYKLTGEPLNKYQSASVSAPIFYATAKNSKWQALHQRESFILKDKKMNHNYYDDTLLTLVLYSLK